MKRIQNDPNMLEEYDFSTGVQGKYAKRYEEGTNVVVIEPDVAKVFPDHDAVNQALRSLAGMHPSPTPPGPTLSPWGT